MRSFTFESMDEAYPKLIEALLTEGEEVSPRGMLTKEITPVGITITNPRNRIITHPVRKLNYGFMVGELLWMLQGKNDLSITHYNKQWANYSDDGETLNGAYGQRVFKWDGLFDIIDESYTDEEGNTHPSFACEHISIDQFEAAYQQLKTDPDTRQASIMLFNPVQDYRETKDKPCTNLMRFTIRNGKLNMMVVMRSNDIWWGFPYDVFNFTMLQELMAGRLGVEMGKYTHVVDSLHIYEDHFETAKELVNTNSNSSYINQIRQKVQDARIMEEDYKSQLKKIFDIENATRLHGKIITAEKLDEILPMITNEYWRSIAATISLYNLKKDDASDEELNSVRKHVTNEFKELI